MKEFTYTITDPVGIHARPAGELVKTIKGLTTTVTITNAAGKSAAGSKLMALMGLGIKKDETITVKLEGAAEETEAAALETYFKEHL